MFDSVLSRELLSVDATEDGGICYEEGQEIKRETLWFSPTLSDAGSA
jgi:hypothetical protein